MSSPERVYALLVEADPVPDPEALAATLEEATSPHLQVVDPRRDTMQTDERVRALQQRLPSRRRWIPALAAGFAAVVAVVVAVVLLASDASVPPAEEPQPAPTLDPESVRMADAEARIGALIAAIGAGDIATVDALAEPAGELLERDRNMYEFLAAVEAAGYGYTSDSEHVECVADEAASRTQFVMVVCDVSVADPVAAELGSENLVIPWRVWSDGHIDWLPAEGAGYEPTNRAYAEYLRAHYPTEYEQTCDLIPYLSAGISAQDAFGLAQTRECAQFAISRANEVAQWLRDGRPTP